MTFKKPHQPADPQTVCCCADCRSELFDIHDPKLWYLLSLMFALGPLTSDKQQYLHLIIAVLSMVKVAMELQLVKKSSHTYTYNSIMISCTMLAAQPISLHKYVNVMTN